MQVMKKLVFLLFILVASCAFGQGEIHGKIFDSETEESLPGANVFVKIGKLVVGASTDKDGRFKLKPLDAGIYDLNVSFIGYQSYKLEDVRVNKDKITFLDNLFINSTITLKIVEVKTERFSDKERLIKPEDTGNMTILPAEIKNHPKAKNLKNLIATVVPAVYQADDNQPLHFRGARSGSIQYIVDGIKLRNETAMIPSSSMGEITVYTGGVPAKYGDLIGGVVVVETKSYFELYNERSSAR